MRIRKVQILVSMLSLEEREDFLRWLSYELNGRQSGTMLMAHGLIRQWPVSEIWERIFPERDLPANPFQDSSYRRTEAHVSNYIETFLTIGYIREDSSLMEWKLLELLNRRHSDKMFVNRYKRVLRAMEKHQLLDESYYHFRYRLEREWRYHLLKKGKRKQLPANLIQLNRHLEAWWLHEKMRAELINIAQPPQYRTQGTLVKEIMNLVDHAPELQGFPLLRIYTDLYYLLSTDDISLAPDIQQWLADRYLRLQPDIVQDIFNILQNYYIKGFHKSGNINYLKSLWDLYCWGVDTRLVLQDGILPAKLYRNLLETGQRLNIMDQVWEYLVTLKPLLDETIREEEFRFNLGGYHARNGDYSMAIRTLGQKFSEPQMEINARLKLLRLRYEEGEREDLDYELRALREFCRRHGELNPGFRQNADNEIRTFQTLIRIHSKEKAAALAEKIQEMTFLGSRIWFLAQTEGWKPS